MASVFRLISQNYRNVLQRSTLFGKSTAFSIASKRNFIVNGPTGGGGSRSGKFVEYLPLAVCIPLFVFWDYIIPLNIEAWFWNPPSIEDWINEETKGNVPNCSFMSARYVGHYTATVRTYMCRPSDSVERKLEPFELKFNPETNEIEGGASEDFYKFELSGMFNPTNGRIGMTQKFTRGHRRKGECVEMRLAWNESTNQFEGKWHLDWGVKEGYSQRDMGDICIYFYGNLL